MRVHGNVNLKDNQLQNFLIHPVTEFPPTAVIGKSVFRIDLGQVYVCVQENPAIWYPMANHNTYIHTQATPSAQWTITHNLNTTDVFIQTYGDDGEIFLADTKYIDTNTVRVTASTTITGKCVIAALNDLIGIPVTHSHNNKAVLDLLSESGGALYYNGQAIGGSGGSDSVILNQPGAVTVLAGSARWYAPSNITVDDIMIAAGVAPTSNDLIIDVRKNGVSIFGATKPTVTAGQNAGSTVAPVPTTMTDTDYLTVDVVQVGSGNPGADMTVRIRYH